MAFLPFYIPARKQLKIVIVGGGYAGIAALTTLVQYMPDAEITIIDPRMHHLKITHLQETFRYPLSDFLVPFTALGQRFGCRHVCAELMPDEVTLQQWQNDKCITFDDHSLPFDYLLIATGAPAKGLVNHDSDYILDLNDFMETAGSELLSKHLTGQGGRKDPISVIGGGATGIQFLFEIVHFLQRHKFENKLRLIESGERVLRQFPDRFAHYVQSSMTELEIDFCPDTYFRGQQENIILLEEKNTGRRYELPSSLSLLFAGKQQGNQFTANTFGQVIVNHRVLPYIFVAGDCSHYQSFGSNALTAQSAVRKGKLAARNILRHSGLLKILEPYMHHDIGYVVSLGSTDAVGWLALENNVVTGIAASVIKEIVEAQYDLLLTGIDTYLI
ncbi:NAD(P)/FAD-dependent oxidoreductase [Nitrosomonas sp. Nm33]|uniref:NAD(P)/FAD-dependent oxidoreductase n=1 Tax=Nitrosomonas sp. Nm33 TaxID=133724 RepID=UPI00089617F8|nr:FAD-dependent oxidoreductase [Nitrosomonas sp. Nm33]SDY60460.1 NADH dehydrogenase [Nitrosomonas sp. Nm33]